MKNYITSKLKIALIFSTLLLPVVSSAQLTQTRNIFDRGLDLIADILIPIAFTLALLFFFWGVAKYILSAGNEKEEGKKIMVWGVVALFVMSSVWGIVIFIRGELGIVPDYDQSIPTILIP